MPMPSRTLILSVALIAACAVLWVATGDIPGPTSWQTYGSARFPRILIATLAGLSVLLLVREILQPGTENAFRQMGAWFTSERRIFLGMVLFGLYIWGMPRAGFRIATLVYLALSLLLLWRPLNRRRVAIAAVISLAATLGVEVVFENALAIRLP